jgi:hypothetical protein
VPLHLVTIVGWYSNTNVYIPKISGSHNQQVPTILKGLFILFLIICRIFMNNNQLNALFIFSLLSYHTSSCFGHISSPSSGGRMYIYMANGTYCTSKLTVSRPGWIPVGLAGIPFQPTLLIVISEVQVQVGYYLYNSRCTVNPT